MFEINPVLAGKFDDPRYIAASTNLTVGNGPQSASAFADAVKAADGTDVTTAAGTASQTDVTTTEQTQDIDPRRYTKWDRTASQVADAPNFSFGDFVDMVNPLQHIPVISSVYRAITGDSINPVSRVAGDILYGGAIGAASAVMGGVTAIADAVSESKDGKDITGQVVASLFGSDKTPATTQLADSANAATSPAALAAAAAPAMAVNPNVATASAQVPAKDTGIPLPTAKAFALNGNKQPFGGVMDTSKNFDAQNMAIALSEGSHGMRLGHTIYTNPLINGEKPTQGTVPAASGSTLATTAVTPTTTVTIPGTPAAPTTATASAAASVAPALQPSLSTAAAAQATLPSSAQAALTANSPVSSNDMLAGAPRTAITGQHNPIPQNLVDDMVMMQALKQYKGVASGPSALGAQLDVTN